MPVVRQVPCKVAERQGSFELPHSHKAGAKVLLHRKSQSKGLHKACGVQGRESPPAGLGGEDLTEREFPCGGGEGLKLKVG